jgi:anthranilate synthase component 2
MRHNFPMLVMIDNYDSFTWNLVHYLGDLGVETKVIRNDRETVDGLLAMNPAGILISPGPGDPDHAGICLPLIKAAADQKIPLLGVCLGHQAIGQAFGGKVIRAPKPMHGRIDSVTHTGAGIYKGIPSPYQVTRYHSLIVERDTLPASLTITAETPDGLIMGLSHKTLPIHGIQYHPESIETHHGHALLKNFVAMMERT